MIDREKVINSLKELSGFLFKEYGKAQAEEASLYYGRFLAVDNAIALLKEQKSLLGIQQTADRITFISTGDAQKGEERGILLGKAFMHEWLKKELIHQNLMTDEIRTVFRDAEMI